MLFYAALQFTTSRAMNRFPETNTKRARPRDYVGQGTGIGMRTHEEARGVAGDASEGRRGARRGTHGGPTVGFSLSGLRIAFSARSLSLTADFYSVSLHKSARARATFYAHPRVKSSVTLRSAPSRPALAIF